MKRRAIDLVTVAALAAVAGCGNFEDPAIVIDLRTLAMVASPTEYVIPFDPANPPDPASIDLDPFLVCGLVADPGVTRTLDWEMTLCASHVEDDGRCVPGHPETTFATGTIEDPETGTGPYLPCAQFRPIGSTFVLIQDAIEQDPLAGFSGVDLEVLLKVVPTGATEAEAVFAAKRVRFAAQIPAERTPNQNPWLLQVDWDTGGDMPSSLPMPLGRCQELTAPGNVLAMTMTSSQTLYLTPQEPPGVREMYLVPTFDGASRMFTENMSYQWLAGAGSYSSSVTGGPKDPFGNDPPLHTEWNPPPADEIDGDFVDVPIWIVQRDERLGASWYQSCVRVTKN